MRFFTSLTVLFFAFLINALPGYGQEELKISVTASHMNANPGDEITYVIKYSNAGLTPASNVIITSQLPNVGTYTYVSSYPQGVVSGNVITWNQSQIAELALLSYGECQITVTVKAGIPGDGITQYSSGYYILSPTVILNNYATIKSNKTITPVQSNEVLTTITQNCNVHINDASGVVKSATNTRVYYMIQITNNGNVYDRYDLSALNYDCDGPGGLGFESLIAEFTDINGNSITKTDWIAPDQTYYFLLRLTVGPGTNPGKWSCHDVIATSLVSGATAVGKIQTQTEGAPHNPLVSLSKIDDKDPVEAGEEYTYTIYAFNANDSYAANNFVIKETYPPNITFISSTPAPDPGYDNQWSLGNLGYGLAGAKTIIIKVRMNALDNCSGNITNTVIASYDGYNSSNPPKATVVTTIKSYPDLAITKTAESSSMPAGKGGSISYTLNYQNIGTCDAPNSIIKDLFDDGHINIVNSGGGTQSGNEISWNLGTLHPGQSGSITYTALIDPASTFNPGTTTLLNKATISTSEIEFNYNNNTAVATIPVSVLPDMKIEVLSENVIIAPGTENTFTLKISNTGDIAANDVEIKYLLPTGLIVGFISDGGINRNGSISWPVISTFEVGSSVEYQVKVTPPCSFIPSIISYASVTSSIIDKDGTNNSATVDAVVQDVILPVLIDIPLDLTTDCNDIPAVGTPTATDNCDGTPVVHFLGEVSTRGNDPSMPDYYNYTLTRSWDAIDASGNHSVPGNQVITVKDVIPPATPILPDVTIGECSGTPVAPTTTDICKGTITGTTSAIFPITAQGTTIVEWTFDDGNGNITKASQNVIVDDTTPPVADVAVLPLLTGQNNVIATAPTATDNCKGSIVGTTTDPLTYPDQGTYTIHWTYDDGNGNITTQTQAVVVDDTLAPDAPVLPGIVVGECSGTPIAPTTTDNASGVITGVTSTIFPLTQQGTTIVTWTFDDGNGNQTTANQNVIVEDITPPVIPILADVTVGECSGTPVAPTTTDNCAGIVTGTTTTPFPITAQGTTLVTWTFDDGNGNTTTSSQNIIVNDITPPVTSILADVTIGECSGTPVAPTTTDNCAGTVTGTTSTLFPITVQGTTIVEWTFDDGHGNQTRALQNVIVEDVTPPATPVLADVTVGECSGTPVAPTTTDNCAGTVTGTTTTPFPISTQGTTIVEWTFDDGHGNQTTANQNVIVEDTTPPVVPLLADVTIGECSGTPVAPTTIDNCAGIVTGTTTTLFPITAQGTTLVTWTFDDGHGNITTANQNVIVEDTTPPEAPVLADVTIGKCSGTPVVPTTTDNCAGTVTGTTTTPFPITAQGTTIVEWTFDDGHGNQTTANQNVIVEDTTPPVVPLLADVTIGECSGTPVAPTTIDNCAGIVTGTTTTPFPITAQGTTIVEWTFDDGHGNITTANQNVIVEDTTPPVVPVLADVTVGECSGTPVAPTTTDNCAGIITGTTTTPFPITVQGTTIVEWTFDDGHGNQTRALQNVIVEDVTPPATPVLADITIGECSGTPVAPTTTDNCAGIITGTTSTLFPITVQGTTIVEWTFDDGNGNTTTASQNIIVNDITPPVTPILADVTIGECSGTPTAPTTTDNCAGTVTGTTTTLFPITAQGTTLVTWTFDDGHGNQTIALQNVIIEDTTPPVVPLLADVTIGECSGTPVAPSTTDNCAGTVTGTTTTPFPITVQGTTIVTWTFDDGHGNITTANQNVIVEDTTPPEAPVLADVTIGKCSGTPVVPTTTDNCAGTVTGTTTTPFPITAQGTTIVEWTFDDGHGNQTTANQNVIVEDTTPPVVPLLADVTIGECSGTPVAPTTTDNCAGTVTGTTSTLFPITAQGTTIVEWTFDDGHGNQTRALQNVIVEDVTPPATPVLADLTVGECSGTPTAPTTTDNCAGIVTGTTTTPFPITAQGTTLVTWTFDDGNGNTTTSSQNIIVNDITPPVTPILADVTIGECSGTPVAPTTSDNCAGIVTGTTTTPFPISTQGTTIVEWTFDDGHGNQTRALQNVIVEDVTPPATPVLADITIGECSGTPVVPTTTDNCAGTIIGTTTTPFPISTQGTTIVTWTFDDGHGNQTTASQNVIVEDITPPVVPVLADVTVGECSGTPTAPTTTDNCAGIIIGTTSTLFPITAQGTTIVEWTFDDGHGNITTANQNVIIEDITPPVVPLLADVTIGECSGTPTAPTTTDNCAGIITGTTTTPFPITAQGTTIVTWTFNDNHGNITTANQNVIVEDITPPVSPILADVTIGECSGTPVAPTATDNCAGIITGTTTTIFPITAQGTTIVTWTFNDGNGNTTTANQNVIVEDITPPVVPLLADVTIGECSGTPVAPTTTDNCAGIITGTTTTPFPITVQGTTIVTWTFDDGHGNQTTANQNVIVEDTTPPLMPVLADVTVGECSGTPTAPTTTDNCAGTVTGTTSTLFPITAQGTTIVEWTFDDGNGNQTRALQNVIVEDITPPVVPVLADVTIGECSGTPVVPTTTDNCAGTVTGTTTTPFPITAQGTTIVEWTFDDGHGNQTTANQNVIVEDTTPPVSPILADVTIGECSGTPVAPTTTDNCAGTVTGTTSTLFPITAQGTTIVEWTFDDGHGNQTRALQNVIVEDVTPPATPVLADVTVGECSGTPTAPTTTDNCAGTVTGTTSTLFPITAQGTTIVEWIFDDGNGNQTTASQNIIVNDITPPVTPILADVTIGECSGTPVAPTTTDNCAGTVTGTTTTPFPITAQGTTIVEWTFDDGHGNITFASQNIIVNDITPPVTPILADVTIGECSGTPTAPTTTDNCAGTVTGTTSTLFPITAQGTTIVEWIFDDGNGNQTTANQNVIVEDTTPPVSPILADVTIGECSGTPVAPTTTDNCAGIITGTTSTLFPITAQGTTIVEWTFDDGHGNQTRALQNVIVEDVTPPATPVLADVTVGECSGTPTAPTTTDNCAGIITGTTTTPFPITVQGTTIVTWTFDDGHGNQTTAIQNVIVEDTTPPEAPVLADVTIGECSGTPVAPTTTDNCAGIVTGTTSTLFPITAQGVSTIEWTFDDGNGNQTRALQNVIVEDTTPPVTPILADVTVGECSGTPVAPTTTDNCAGIITGTTTTPFPISTQGTTIVTWTFNDNHGNITTANQNVIVEDITPPVVPLLADVTIGECSGTPTAPTTTDNCAGIVTGTTTTSFPITMQGTNVVNWTFNDGHGNVTTAFQNVIIEDTTPPVVPVLASISLGECGGTPPVPTTTDNCTGTITSTTTTLFPITIQGVSTIEWIFDDHHGNISTALQNVIVEDITPPVTPILADVTVGECSGTPVAPTTTDNCAGTITGTTSTLFPITAQGTTIVEWTFDDGHGNQTTALQNVIVEDTTPPEAPVLAEVTVGECSVTPEVPTTTDNCGGIISGTTTTHFPITTQDTTVVTWTFDDGNGNQTTVSQIVIVNDVTPPQITGTIASTTVEGCTDADAVTAVTTVAELETLGLSITDNCASDNSLTVTHSDVSAGITPVVVTRTYTISDPSGNAVTRTQSIRVVDSQDPLITCASPLDSYQADNGKCTYTVLGSDLDPIATSDNCSVKSVTNDFTNTSTLKDAVFPLGTTHVTWTIEDMSGNTSSSTYEVVVVDTQHPTISCAAPATSYPSDPGGCTYRVLDTNLDPVATSDNCSVKSVTNDFTNTCSLKDAVFPLGTTIVTWTVEDTSGNRASCSYTILVADRQAPVITCPAPAASYSYHTFGTELDPVASDNCTIASVTNDFNNSASLAGAVFPTGSTMVTWTATDVSGNSATCSHTIVIIDTQPPVINCAFVFEDGYITDPESNVYNVPGTALDPTAEDNYSKVSLVNNYNNTSSLINAPFPVGETTVIWTATDTSGNAANCTQIIKVRDIQQPTITCPADIQVVAEPGKCSAFLPDLGMPITSDNCSVSTVRNDAPSVFSAGITKVIWTATDASGNSATCIQTVTVNGTHKAVDDLVSVNEDSQLSGNVLTNDDGCKVTVVVQEHSEPTHGRLTIAGDGSYTYIPDENYFGEDSFTYKTCSVNGDCSEATVHIAVESVDDLPRAVNDTHKLVLDLVLEGNVAANDLISGDGGNVWSLADSPSHGTIDFHQDGTYSYSATIDFQGPDRFTYQLCDQDGDCVQATVSIVIEDVLSPNQILTPNGDLINDTFIIDGISLYPENKVTIYNRWGNIVYRKNNYQNEWDGAANGNKIGSQPLPVGTYYYLVDYGKNRHKTGFVYLDR